MRSENLNYPRLIASPSVVRTAKDIKSTEIMDFTQYVLGGKVVLKLKKPDPFYYQLKSWKIKLKKDEYLRNQDKVRIRMFAEHGELKSFYSDKYPEAKPILYSKLNKIKKEKEEEQ